MTNNKKESEKEVGSRKTAVTSNKKQKGTRGTKIENIPSFDSERSVKQ
jgi:hypothetical protein